MKDNTIFVRQFGLRPMLGDFNFSITDLIKLDTSTVNDDEFEKCWFLIKSRVSVQHSKSRIKRSLFLSLCRELNIDGRIKGYERLEKERNVVSSNLNFQQIDRKSTNNITPEFIEQVDLLLPKQPWKPGTHKEIASKLRCSEKEIYLAVTTLIGYGRRFKQKDGIVYNADGSVKEIDEERVDTKTLKLKEGSV